MDYLDFSLTDSVRAYRDEIASSMVDPTDQECLDYFNICKRVVWDEGYIKKKIDEYEILRHSEIFKDSMDSLRMHLGKYLSGMIGALCDAGSDLLLYVSPDRMDAYRRELELADGTLIISESSLSEYAFARQFFDYRGDRYLLNDRNLLARHFFLHHNRIGRSQIQAFFECYGMMVILQDDIVRLRNSLSYNLKTVRGFTPDAVLQCLERIEPLSSDPARLRDIVCQVMVRNADYRFTNGSAGFCPPPKASGAQFNKCFLVHIVGAIKWYTKLFPRVTNRQIAEAFAKDTEDMTAKTAETYLSAALKDLSLTPESINLIREIIRRGG